MNTPFLIMALGLSSINAAKDPQAIHRCEMKAGKSTVVGLGVTPNTALLLASELCTAKAGTPKQCSWERVKCDEVPKEQAVKVVTSFANAHPDLAERVTQTGFACRVDSGMNTYSAITSDREKALAETESDCLQNDLFGTVCKKESIKCMNLAESTGAREASARTLSASAIDAEADDQL